MCSMMMVALPINRCTASFVSEQNKILLLDYRLALEPTSIKLVYTGNINRATRIVLLLFIIPVANTGRRFLSSPNHPSLVNVQAMSESVVFKVPSESTSFHFTF